uniref:Uncharacterized protein n=2 Tax=Cryptomonas curvata TaxID=233186 RepID=A0A7S0N504_9CRYP|mmetsp:Transcript_7114/g.15393  ORF Transcript_7114/g.15393 Transcript_7114/m.15393 type:complete len:150 (+) Transcript_7114:211-660(+)
MGGASSSDGCSYYSSALTCISNSGCCSDPTYGASTFLSIVSASSMSCGTLPCSATSGSSSTTSCCIGISSTPIPSSSSCPKIATTCTESTCKSFKCTFSSGTVYTQACMTTQAYNSAISQPDCSCGSMISHSLSVLAMCGTLLIFFTNL